MTYGLPPPRGRIITKLLMLFCLVMIIRADPLKIEREINHPFYAKNKMPLTYEIAYVNKSINLPFPEVNYQISSKFYSTKQSISGDQAHNISSYDNSLNGDCALYPTTINTLLIEKAYYTLDQEDVKNLQYTLYFTENSNTYYMIGSDSKIHVYSFNKSNLIKNKTYAIDNKILNIQNKVFSKGNVQMIVVGNQLFIANNQSLYLIRFKGNQTTYTTIQGYEASSRVVSIGVISRTDKQTEVSGHQIWVCTGRDIIIYQFSKDGQSFILKKVQSHSNSLADSISAVTYDSFDKKFYVVASKTLYIFLVGRQNPLSQYQIEGVCNTISKIKTSLYLGCQYDRVNFVAQLTFSEGKLYLNRYYDDSSVEGIRNVQSLGFDKIALIGDEEALVIGQAVNRNVLLDLQKEGETQKSYSIYSFGLIDFNFLPHYSTSSHSTILVSGQNGLGLFKIIYQPPQLACQFNFSAENSGDVNVLIVFNSTHCPYIVDKQYDLSGSNVICESFFPYQIQKNVRQYEEKTANFIFFVVMLTITVLLLICAGCGAQIRRKSNQLIEQLRNKIEKMKNQRDHSQLKKI